MKCNLLTTPGWEGEDDGREREDESKAIEFERLAESRHSEKVAARQINLDAKGNYRIFY